MKTHRLWCPAFTDEAHPTPEGRCTCKTGTPRCARTLTLPIMHARTMAAGLRREIDIAKAAGDLFGSAAAEHVLGLVERADAAAPNPEEETIMPARRRKKPIDEKQTVAAAVDQLKNPGGGAQLESHGFTNGHANGTANGAAAKPAEPPKPRKVTRYIDHKLTPTEQNTRGVEHRKILAQIDDAKASAKDSASGHKSRINALQEQERAKRIAADTGIERRSVACEERRNEQLSQIDTVRLDTGKVLDSRPMTADERQLVIPGTAPATEASEPKQPKKKRRSKMGGQAEATV